MASKRGAGSELTDRNWDQEEEPEEAGSFKQADDAAIKQRVIKTAKRRGPSSGAGGSGAFSGFGGFGASSSGAKPGVSFSFGGASTTSPIATSGSEVKPAVNFSFGGLDSASKSEETTEPKKPTGSFSFGGLVSASKSEGTTEPKKPIVNFSFASSSEETLTTTGAKFDEEVASSTVTSSEIKKVESSSTSTAAAASNEGETTESKSASEAKSVDKAKTERKYLAHVKTLNKSVLAWIQKHVEDRPTCILTPVFEDYERHLKRIEERFGVVPSDNEDSEPEGAATGNMANTEDQEKPETNGSKSEHDTATSNGIYSEKPGDKDDTFSATKTRFTCTTPSQTAARGMDASLKEIDSKDRSEKEDSKDGEDKPKLSHFASFSAIKTNHTFSFSNLSHTRAPTSSCNSSMKPTFSFCVSSSGEKPSETYTTSTTAAAAAASCPASTANNAGLFSFGSGGSSLGGSGGSAATSSAASSTSESNKGIFSFGSSATTSSATSFSFGSGGGGMFGSSSTSGGMFGSGSAPSFSFGSSSAATTFSGFGASVAAASQNGAGSGDAAAGGEEDEYVPPKPEVQEVGEDDAVFTKRCKLFYKKDEGFVDRGVGNLFIKPLPSSEDGEKKFSLLVRADTNLGNILLNISLNSLKFNKMGAKDISFLCVPNPLPDPKMAADTPVIMLLRVKDSDLRDEVLEQLSSHA